MKKALLVTTVSGFVPQFEMNNVRLLREMGFEIHYAANYNTPSYGKDNHRLDGTGIVRHQIDFVRSPFRPETMKAYKQLKQLMQEEHFDLVHCHTPMGGVLARLAAHATNTRPVIYTAHGFHFFHGAPLKNWLFYYPVEWFLSRYTDQQICINQEDFMQAKNHFSARYVDYIPGVGIDVSKICPVTPERRKKERKKLGIPSDKMVLLSVGELIKRKNHETIIKALAELKDKRFLYVICGHGQLESYLKDLVKKLDMEEQVWFLGYREDMDEVYSIGDIFTFPSYQEGLPRALLEAMGSGLSVICSDIRGSKDLMENFPKEKKKEHQFGTKQKESSGNRQFKNRLCLCKGGILVNKADDAAAYAEAIAYMAQAEESRVEMGRSNRERVNDFDIGIVSGIMEKIYRRISGNT